MRMPKISNSVFLGRRTVVTAGVCASLALGAAGTAMAETQGASLLGLSAAGKLADVTRAQADVQQRAAATVKTDRHARADHQSHVGRSQKSAPQQQNRGNSGWMAPVQKYVLSAGYAQNGARWAHKHSGQDFAVAIGTKVHAVHAGTVVEAGWGGAYGNNIVIRHSNGMYSQYAHLSKMQVRVGQHVGEGQQIALSGNTGNSTGPHLHFEIRKTPYYGSSVNPLPYLRAHGVSV
ncbi:M23 family metallopeptidase [Streptomyces sp. NPDC026673]|uniref:M23 family metallopeptidase n=1 Tax=Streptomyces sp. NPDC026673 TaxID=3155724 RepID=UPI0033CF938B